MIIEYFASGQGERDETYYHSFKIDGKWSSADIAGKLIKRGKVIRETRTPVELDDGSKSIHVEVEIE